MTDVKPSGKVHPAAEFFPLMGDVELKALADDIKANGLRQPLVLDENGDLLDGRNRLAACKLAKVKPDYVTATGDDSFALVVSLNAMRRDLTKQQRAVIAALSWNSVSPQKRGRHGRADVLAQMFGVSRAHVQRARALVQEAPKVAEAIRDGRVGLDGAWEALEEARAQRAALEEEEERWERERKERREQLQQMTDDLLQVELLPPPRPEELEEPTPEQLKQATAQADRSVDLREPSDALKLWDATLRDASILASKVRSRLSMGYPEDADELMPITVRAVARALTDAASRLVGALPAEKRTMRRVK